jgi:uncharacterized protein YsxB (DUF464 family)
MINITFDPKNFELKIEGHAGQAKKGEDIVCASVSMLFFTLAESLNRSVEMLKKAPIIQYEDGNGYLKCRPRKEYMGNIARTYWTILVGIELLAEQFSQYITFKVIGGEEE